MSMFIYTACNTYTSFSDLLLVANGVPVNEVSRLLNKSLQNRIYIISLYNCIHMRVTILLKKYEVC